METELVEINGKQIQIKRFGIHLIPEFIKLFQACFKKTISTDSLVKKYDTDKLGGSYLGFMAFHQGLPIAYYGVLPVPFVLNGKELVAVQSADTMTHPDYRRHGLFPMLAEMTYDQAKKEGVAFVFGWPNENSFPTFKNKLGWIELGRMQRFSIHVNTAPLAKVFFKLKALRPAYLKFATSVLRANPLNHKILNDANNSIPLTDEYLRYKEALGAFSVSTPFGVLFCSLDYRLKIGFMDANQLNHLTEILDGFVRKCRICGITEIQIIVSPQSAMANLLLSAGMKKTDDLPLMYRSFSDDLEMNMANFTGLDYDGF